MQGLGVAHKGGPFLFMGANADCRPLGNLQSIPEAANPDVEILFSGDVERLDALNHALAIRFL